MKWGYYCENIPVNTCKLVQIRFSLRWSSIKSCPINALWLSRHLNKTKNYCKKLENSEFFNKKPTTMPFFVKFRIFLTNTSIKHWIKHGKLSLYWPFLALLNSILTVIIRWQVFFCINPSYDRLKRLDNWTEKRICQCSWKLEFSIYII